MTEYLMVENNALHVPSMSNNPIPIFILRESGLIVNEIPKIHAKVPTKEHHCIYDANFVIRIPLFFTGMFTYLKTRSPTSYKIENCREYDVTYLSSDAKIWNMINRRCC